MTTNPPGAGPQSEAQRALDEIEAAMSFYQLGNCLRGYAMGEFPDDQAAWNDLRKKFNKAYPSENGREVELMRRVYLGNSHDTTLRAALAPPATPSPPAWLLDLDEASAVREIAARMGVPVDTGADEIGAIRGRHEVAEKDSGWEWAGLYADEAHADRATLLDRDARHVAEIARLTAELAAERERRVEVEGALKEIAQTSGTGCNPEGFAKIARAALKGDV